MRTVGRRTWRGVSELPLDEAIQILELRKHRLHDKPVVVLLNIAAFYDGLRLQLQRMETEGFLPVPLAELAFVADECAEALEYLAEVL
ncbi:MAG: LOG family protein [Mycobacterium sp.]